MRLWKDFGLLILLGLVVLIASASPAAETKAKGTAKKKASAASGTTAKKSVAAAPKTAPRKKRVVYSPWSVPTFAESTTGDDIGGEDLTVRQAAVQALGRYNGSVVAVDPLTGRILTMVNQKTALESGFQPCSTVKLPVAMAGLIEGLIERDTPLRVQGATKMTLTEALARSNNSFFAMLGNKLGFARFSYYARLLGLGEKAGLNIQGEKLGAFPQAPPPGTPVGLMTSFGEGIALTPLQLAAMLSAFSNGGTLYYLQYPKSLEEVRDFAPKVKRRLAIGQWVPEIRPGMAGAVEYGTARRANYDATEPIFGKTGTCTENRTHLGWFGSYNQVGRNPLVVVVLLTGGKGVSGSAAAEIAGNMYKRLSQESFFADASEQAATSLASVQSCCLR